MTAYNRNRATLDYALRAGIIDAAPPSLEQAIAEAELIGVGVPTLSVGRIFAAIGTTAAPTRSSPMSPASRAAWSLPRQRPSGRCPRGWCRDIR